MKQIESLQYMFVGLMEAHLARAHVIFKHMIHMNHISWKAEQMRFILISKNVNLNKVAILLFVRTLTWLWFYTEANI